MTIVVVTLQYVADHWSFFVLGAMLVIAAITDVRSGKIHNWLTYPVIAIALIGHTLTGGPTGYGRWMGLSGSLCGLAVGFLPLLAAWLAGGIGGGDAKLMGAVGALGGWRFAVAGMFYGFLVAAVMALIVMLRRKIMRRTLGRVLRFLALLLTPTKPADPATEDSPTVPFGLALCIGAAAALLEVARELA